MTENKNDRGKSGRQAGPPHVRKTFWIEVDVWNALKKLKWGEKSPLINNLLKEHFNEEGNHNGNKDI